MERNFESAPQGAGRLIANAVGFTPFMSSEQEGWRSASLYMWRGVSDECQFPVFDEAIVVFHTGGAGRVPCYAGARSKAISHPGLITVIPPATPVTWEICGRVHSYSVHLPAQAFRKLTDRPLQTIEKLRFKCAFSDPVLSGLITAMADEVAQPRELGSLYIDAITDGMALHLLRNAQADVADPGGLPPAALRRILNLIENRIEAGISLQTLATEAGLSRAWFSSAFRRSMGVSPHRYLTERRIGASRHMLETTLKPLSEISSACGFSSQAHFTDAFRRAVGATPAAYRRNLA